MSQNNPLRALLDKQDILLLDGAMATELEARGCNLADSLVSQSAGRKPGAYPRSAS